MDNTSSHSIPGQTIVDIPPVASGMASDSQQEEGLLRDVLDQLDYERSKRAEVEAQMRKLANELATERSKPQPEPQPEDDGITKKAYMAMEAQVKGYQELVEAMTRGKPAIAAAAAQESKLNVTGKRQQTLPLHAVRLLEVMPWDPRAAEHIFGQEEIFEWQIFDTPENRWQSNIRFFPSSFKSLPLVKPSEKMEETTSSKDRSLLAYLAGGDKTSSSPSKHGVLTNDKITLIYKIEDGYPLPQNGGRWEWIGGWRVDNRIQPVNGQENVTCDEHGWSYAFEPSNFLLTTNTINNAPSAARTIGSSRVDGTTGQKRNVRRRKWSRRRVLVDYPLASDRTRQYLQRVVENARLTVTAAKLSEQLVQTKMALTETEEGLLRAKAALQKQDEVFRAAGVSVEAVGFLTNTDKSDESVGSLQDFLPKNEQVREFGSKITQWVKSARKTSEDLTSVESGEDDAMAKVTEDSTPQKFPWKKIGRGALIEKLARPGHGSARSSAHGRSNSNGSNAVEEINFSATKQGPPV